MPYLNLHPPTIRKPCVTVLMNSIDPAITIVTDKIPDSILFVIADKEKLLNNQREPLYEISDTEYYFLNAIYKKDWTLERALNVYGFEYKWIAFKLFTLESHVCKRYNNRNGRRNSLSPRT